MRSSGAQKFRTKSIENIERGRGTLTTPGTHLLKSAINPLAEAIDTYVKKALSGTPALAGKAAPLIASMNPETAAYITARCVLNVLASGKIAPLTNLAVNVGTALEDEARFTYYQREAPGLYRRVSERVSAFTTTDIHKKRVFVYTMNKGDVVWNGWPKRDKLILGIRMIELFAESTGFVSTSKVQVRKGKYWRPQYVVEIQERALSFIRHHLDRGELLRPQYLPTIIQPLPWNSLVGGGYHTPALEPLPLVKGVTKDHEKLLREADLSEVYRTVNAVQETAWTINTKVLDVFREACEKSYRVGGLTAAGDLEIPPHPGDDASDELKKEWKKDAADIHRKNIQNRHEQLRQATVLTIAERFEDGEPIYFPHQLDFRGRVYPIPHHMNPQTEDYSRALLKFHKGLPLTDRESVDWFYIHGANMFGYDKVSFEDRIRWVEENRENIIDASRNPLENDFWQGQEVDKPWLFLAWCFEAAEYWDDPYYFVSHIPVAQDGSCNGIQHFSAMLRDEVGGSAVNLTTSDRPQDIYQRVADRVMERLRDGVSDHEAERWIYEAWISIGIDRDITKRPVMVLPYGGTRHSCFDYVTEAVDKKIAKLEYDPFGENLGQAVSILAGHVWASLGDVVVAAKDVMGWLQKAAKVATDNGLSLHWETPTGFIVHQDYRKFDRRIVKTKLHGSIVRPTLYGETDDISRKKQAAGISPNFVHSMDASAMTKTVNVLHDAGVRDFAVVHDSFGTHAANAELMARTLRQEFVSMYQRDVLEEFRDRLQERLPEGAVLPPLPPKGELDLNEVLRSPFFFA